MPHDLPAPTPSATGPALHDALDRLARLGASVNRIGLGHDASLAEALRLTVESIADVMPGVSAAVSACDPDAKTFDRAPQVMAGSLAATTPELGDRLQLEPMAALAMRQHRRVLSYDETGVGADGNTAAAACLPLEVADKLLGVLSVWRDADQPFSSIELFLLDNFANQAAMAIFQARQVARVQRDLARTEDELVRLRRADLLISSRLKLEDTLEAILQMALEVTGAHYGIFRLVDRSGAKLVTAAFAGDNLGRPAVEALPINTTSIMGWVAKYRQPLCIADLQANPWSRVYYPLDRELEMRSELAVPLIGASGRLEGVLNLESPTVGAFSDQDSHLLQALATQAVIAIQEVRLLDALQETAERLLTQPPQQVFDRLVQMACELLNVPVGSIWVLEDDQLILQTTNTAVQRKSRLPLHDSLIGQAILSRGPITADDVRTHPQFRHRELAQAHGWAGALVVPLLVGQAQPIGAFGVYSAASDPRHFAEADWDKKVLAVLAHHAALAVQEATRREALRASEEQRAVAETFAAVGDIAANLLHRVNNKIGTIPVRVEGIQDKSQAALQADPYLAANLREIEQSADEAMAIMRESLYHLRPIRMMPVDVAEAVKEALWEAGLPPDILVRQEGLDTLPPVIAGPHRLSLVFANLIENAATAMEGQGVITLRGSVHNQWIEVMVADTGPGIPPELHERIFDFDFSNRKTHPSKLGFGLWWVKTLMARFGGSVAVESDGQHGTTFILRLPAVADGHSGQLGPHTT